MDIMERLKAVEQAKPKEGFNVVSIDTYEMDPADAISVLAHFESKAEADAMVAAKKKANPDGVYYVYSAD